MRLRYQPALDGLRAVAVLAVIAYHAGLGPLGGGFLGVDAFFVLSGFLITSLLLTEYRQRRAIHLVGFWGRRARRLLPALLLMLLVVAAYSAGHLPSIERAQFRGDALASLCYLTNWRFISSGVSYFASVSSPNPLRHLWSLAIEEQFYVVWPLVVLAGLRISRGRVRRLAIACGAGIVGSTLLMAAHYQRLDASRSYYGTDTRAHAILVGALLALVLTGREVTGERTKRAVAGSGVVAAGVVLWMMHATSGDGAFYYRGGSLLFAAAVAAVIAAVVQPGRSRLGWLLALPPMVWIGRISYGLYLWHWPVDVYLNEARTGVSGVALSGVRVAVTFVLATASFYLVELPIRHGRVSRRVSTVLAPVSIALTATVVVTTLPASAAVPSYLGGGATAISTRSIAPPSGAAPAPLPVKRGVGAQTNIEIYPCPPPTDDEQSEALDATRASGEPPPAVPGGPVRVLVIGDSVACSVAVGLEPAGAPAIDVKQVAVLGCGVVSDEVWDASEPFPKETQHCHDYVNDLEQAALAEFRPQVVLWVSTWERFNLVAHGRVLDTGTAPWRRELGRRLDAAFDRLTVGGARLLVATIASPAPSGLLLGERVVSPQFDWKFAEMNSALEAFVHRHRPRAELVDVAHEICPQGPPCPADVDGVEPRKLDGAHFDPAGSVWLARWMLPEILAAVDRG